MRRLFCSLLLLVWLVGQVAYIPVVQAQTYQSRAVIQSNGNVETSKNIIFDASQSVNPDTDYELTYDWDFGDGSSDDDVQVVHSYRNPGVYTVRLTATDRLGNTSEATQIVNVYDRKFLLITDNAEEREQIQFLRDYARNRAVFIEVISSFDSLSEFISEETLAKRLTESLESIQDTDKIVIWTQGTSGLTVFSRLKETFEAQNVVFEEKDLVYVVDQNLRTTRNIAQGVFNTITPNRIILTRSESLWPFVDSESTDQFTENLVERGIEFEMINSRDRVNIFNFMTYFINYMLENGVPSNSLRLILMLPVIVTVVAFLKQIIGFTTLGVYTPSILTLSFIALDIKFGLFILLFILLFGTLARLFLRRYRLQYIPRMAIVLTIVSIVILFLLLAGAFFNITQLVTISIFPMLIMSTLVERFVSIQSGKGIKQALLIMGEAILVAVICYYIAEWNFLKTLMLGNAELIFVFLAINIVLGRWTGLRLFEYFRFREISQHIEE